MATLDVDFYSKLAAVAGVATEQNKTSETTAEPRVWFQRREANVDLLLSGTPQIADTMYDVEVYGLDIDAVGTLADTLKTTLHGYRGTMGSTHVLGMFVMDATDDYQPRNTIGVGEDEGFHGFAFSVEILT